MKDHLEALDIVLKNLRGRKKPLSIEKCKKLADLLEKIIKNRDFQNLLLDFKIQLPDVEQKEETKKIDGEWNLWEFKKVTSYKGGYLFPIPLFNDQKPSIMAVNDGCYAKIKDWDKERVKTKEWKGRKYYWFNWFPNQLDQNSNMLVNYLKKNDLLYVNNNK